MKITKFSKWAENTVGKGEIAHQEQFLLFSQCLQTRKNQGLFEKGLKVHGDLGAEISIACTVIVL